MTQPALSMQIQGLEKYLGLPLVERRPGEVALTDIGLEIAVRGGQIFTAARDLVDFARHGNRLLSGRLTLGIIPTLAPYVLPRVLPRLQAAYHELRIELRETQTKNLVDELIRGELDLIMLALPVAETDIETIRLFDDPFLLAVPGNDPRPTGTEISPRDIDEDRLILLEEGHCLRDQAVAYCGQARSGGALGLGATSLATVMQMVANGYGVTLVPQIAIDAEVRDERVKLLRFTPPRPGRTVGMAWRPTSPRKADFMALGELVSETLGIGRPPRPGRKDQMSASR